MQSDGDFELHSLWDNKKRETEVEPELMKLPGCLGQILQTQDIYLQDALWLHCGGPVVQVN